MARAQRRAQKREPLALLVGTGFRGVPESPGKPVDPQQRRINGNAGRCLPSFRVRNREPAGPNLLGHLLGRQVAPQARGPQVARRSIHTGDEGDEGEVGRITRQMSR
jgi:hypothetical protein